MCYNLSEINSITQIMCTIKVCKTIGLFTKDILRCHSGKSTGMKNKSSDSQISLFHRLIRSTQNDTATFFFSVGKWFTVFAQRTVVCIQVWFPTLNVTLSLRNYIYKLFSQLHSVVKCNHCLHYVHMHCFFEWEVFRMDGGFTNHRALSPETRVTAGH